MKLDCGRRAVESIQAAVKDSYFEEEGKLLGMRAADDDMGCAAEEEEKHKGCEEV